MNSKIGIIIGREYRERVSKKSFIISTILMPLLMLGMMIAPALISIFSTEFVAVIKIRLSELSKFIEFIFNISSAFT